MMKVQIVKISDLSWSEIRRKAGNVSIARSPDQAEAWLIVAKNLAELVRGLARVPDPRKPIVWVGGAQPRRWKNMAQALIAISQALGQPDRPVEPSRAVVLVIAREAGEVGALQDAPAVWLNSQNGQVRMWESVSHMLSDLRGEK